MSGDLSQPLLGADAGAPSAAPRSRASMSSAMAAFFAGKTWRGLINRAPPGSSAQAGDRRGVRASGSGVREQGSGPEELDPRELEDGDEEEEDPRLAVAADLISRALRGYTAIDPDMLRRRKRGACESWLVELSSDQRFRWLLRAVALAHNLIVFWEQPSTLLWNGDAGVAHVAACVSDYRLRSVEMVVWVCYALHLLTHCALQRGPPKRGSVRIFGLFLLLWTLCIGARYLACGTGLLSDATWVGATAQWLRFLERPLRPLPLLLLFRVYRQIMTALAVLVPKVATVYGAWLVIVLAFAKWGQLLFAQQSSHTARAGGRPRRCRLCAG